MSVIYRDRLGDLSTVGTSMVFTDRDAIVAATIATTVQRITTTAYDAARPFVGGATYRRSDATETASYPALAWFTSADGAYWLLDEVFKAPEMLGAIGNGSDDDLPAVQACLDIGGVVRLGTEASGPIYRCSTTPVMTKPTRIIGTRKTDRIQVDCSNTEEGLFIKSSDVTIENFEIMANASTAIDNGTGDKGTCVTVSEWYTAPDQSEPDLVKNVVIRDMRLTRKSGSEAAHAIAFVSRTSGVLVENCDFIGAGSTAAAGYHSDAFLIHWGAHTHGVSTTQLSFDGQTSNFTEGSTLTGGTSGATGYIVDVDDSGVTGILWLKSVNGTFVDNEAITDAAGGAAVANGAPSEGERQARFEAGHYSFHPNNIAVRNCRLRNTGRLIACSACYSVDVDGIDYYGPVQGGQLIDLTIGDEGSTFAHPDDAGRVYDGFSFKNIRAHGVTGTGANAVTVIDGSGFGTSKQNTDDLSAYGSAPYVNEAYAGTAHAVRRLFEWKNVAFDNITFDAGPSTPPSVTTYERMIYLRNMWGSFTFRNVHATARPPVAQIQYDAETAAFTAGETVTGGTSGAAAKIIAVDDNGSDGILFIENVTGTFVDNETLTDGESGSATADGVVTFGPDVLALELANVIGSFTFDTCTFVGGVSGDKTEGVHFTNCKIKNSSTDAGTQAVVWDGEKTTFTNTATALSAGATSITLSSALTKRVLVGQRITFAGGMVRCSDYGEIGDDVLKVTALPIGVAGSSTFTIDQFSRDLSFTGCCVEGGDEGYNISHTIPALIQGGIVRGAGQYGVLANTDSDVYTVGTTFADNGQRRLVDGSLSTRDVLANPDATFIGKALRFEQSDLVLHNVANNVGAEKVSIVDSVFSGSPITGKTSFLALTNAKPIIFHSNTDGTGLPVWFGGTWTPTLTLGGSAGALALTINSATYTVFDNRMFLDFDITITTLGAETGALEIAGLPHAVEDGSIGDLLCITGVTLNGTGGARLRTSSQEILCFEQGTSGSTAIQHSHLSSSSQLVGSIEARLT